VLLELADYYSLLFLAPFLALELVWRARRYDAPRGWRLRALVVSLAMFGLSLGVGRAWGALLPQWSLVDGGTPQGLAEKALQMYPVEVVGDTVYLKD